MKPNVFFDQLSQDLKSSKLTIVLVLLTWILTLAATAGLVFFYVERRGQALAPTPGGTSPLILLDPATGPVGTYVTVRGESWRPGSMVLIYLMTANETQLPAYAVAGSPTNLEGRFTTGFLMPPDPRWEGQAQVLVIARADESDIGAQANFRITSQVSQPTATEPPTPTVAPIVPSVAPIEPTATPSVTVEPTATPTAAAPLLTAIPELAPPLVTATTDLNIRTGPGTVYPIVGLLPARQTAEVTGVSLDGGWWQIKFPGVASERGWVSADYVIAQNTDKVLLVQAPPPPAIPTLTPTPVIIDWRGEYYANRNLAGTPALVRNDPAIDFDWGHGSPAAGLPADNFSARWSRNWNFSEGVHRFHVLVDDGVRLYVDNIPVIDSWHDGGRREVIGERWLSSGNHSLRVDYYEHLGEAFIRVWAEKIWPSAPEAEFRASPKRGSAPLRVKFENESKGNYDDCKWTFGDDDTSRACDDPSHTYRRPGTYTVRLRIRGPGGEDTKKKSEYITVYEPTEARFNASPTSGPAPLTVNFTNRSTGYDSCMWVFGDGNTSTRCRNPSHTYTKAGFYTVNLIVDGPGGSDVKTKVNYIAVIEPPTPTDTPTPSPTTTTEPTSEPTAEPTFEPTPEPTAEPTSEPTVQPTTEPTLEPTPEPVPEPTTEPTSEPTIQPTSEPTTEPTLEPTAEPTLEPAPGSTS